MSEKQSGTIKWFNNEKGYGFAISEVGDDVFIHHREMISEGFKTLATGQAIAFYQVQSEKGWQGSEVEVLETA